MKKSLLFLALPLVFAGWEMPGGVKLDPSSALVTDAEEETMGAEAFAKVKSSAKLSTDPKANAMLKRVGERLAKAADQPDFKWEFILIDDAATANAFCLPGGRVAFFTGLLPITKDETGMATVLSHEVAHAVKHHSKKRLAMDRTKNIAKSMAVSKGYIDTAGKSAAADVVYKYGMGLPFSRSEESDADSEGLLLMAKAGYDPRQAVPFWESMKAASGAGKKWDVLSTHPSDDKRIANIQKQLPEALKHYSGK